MKAIFLITVLSALAAIWWSERLSAARLEAEVDARQMDARDVDALRLERDRLRTLQPSATELAALRHAGAQRAQLQAAVEAQDAGQTSAAPRLALGEWRSADAWKNCGQATPNAAIETTLWAAAGGDISALKHLLSISDDTRRKAEALLAQLPAAERDRYATAEDLIAEVTVTGIPVGSAQLVWLNQPNDDDAMACVFLQKATTDEASGAAEPSPAAVTREAAMDRWAQLKATRTARPSLEPPHGPDNGQSSETFLSLHREGDGWRLVVPPSVIESIAQALPPSRSP